MSPLRFAPTIATLPKVVLVAAGAGVVLVLLLLWLVARLSRRHVVVIGESEAIRTAIIQMARIADSLERLSFSLQAKPPTEAEGKETGRVFSSLSR
jgi:hypothetical protein